MTSYDVAIVGAGPAGSATAKVIAESGFDVILIERDNYPGENNVCAGGVPKSVVKDFDLLDTVEKEIKYDILYFPWGEKEIRRENVTVYRYVFDRRLAEKAVESGTKLLTRTTIVDVEVTKDDIKVITKDNKKISAKLVIFADGPNTLAYRKFGIGFKPDADKLFVAVVCEVRWENNPFDSFELYFDPSIVPWGYGWVFPKKNTVNIGLGCLYSKLNDNMMKSLKFFLKEYRTVGDRFGDKEIVWLRAATIPAAPAEKIYSERMLVVGDAAGMVDPISGGGIAHAIAGGVIAGKVCIEALESNDFSFKMLSKYQKLWTKSLDYYSIKVRYLLSTIFLFLFKFDKRAYAKLVDFGYGKESKLKKILKILK